MPLSLQQRGWARVGFGDGVYVFFFRLWPSRSAPLTFPQYFSAFFFQFNFLVLFEPRPGSSVIHSSSGGMVAPSVGTETSLSSPSYFCRLPPILVWPLLLPGCSCAIVTHSFGLDCSQVSSCPRPRLPRGKGQYPVHLRQGEWSLPGPPEPVVVVERCHFVPK